MCHILLEDSEHIVRKEAALAIGVIVEKNELISDMMTKFYDSMTHSVTNEDNADVRKNALQFWSNIINKHLSLQGMTDNDFPEATFSKELKKIVILDETEIKKRLVKVMYQLSENGCLSILRIASEDSSTKVIATVEKIVRKLLDLLYKYEVSVTDLEKAENTYSIKLNNKELLENMLSKKVSSRKVLIPKQFLDSMNDFLYPCQNIIEKRDGIKIILDQLMASNAMGT